ncbi:PREDICTED: uncharacterized protein C1orf186 homolog [Charadrius vociferus]|uniref:uncharacterized protein C1orf186 homolog n=1 Tax=Charadrius vociferus TaxID=50402 RepID=UPI000521A928|nr:PREDICTED: uncharacterized protein C1orf186 homolog [Charadrius vociferus]
MQLLGVKANGTWQLRGRSKEVGLLQGISSTKTLLQCESCKVSSYGALPRRSPNLLWTDESGATTPLFAPHRYQTSSASLGITAAAETPGREDEHLRVTKSKTKTCTGKPWSKTCFEAMAAKRWVLVAISAVTLILYALLLLTLYIALSRKIGSSDTSSETSEDSDSSPSTPQVRRPSSAEKLNYTSLVFPGKGHGSGSARDYENVKTGEDYVNVDPKKRKVDFWPCSSPVASKSIEYTEVKL